MVKWAGEVPLNNNNYYNNNTAIDNDDDDDKDHGHDKKRFNSRFFNPYLSATNQTRTKKSEPCIFEF